MGKYIGVIIIIIIIAGITIWLLLYNEKRENISRAKYLQSKYPYAFISKCGRFIMDFNGLTRSELRKIVSIPDETFSNIEVQHKKSIEEAARRLAAEESKIVREAKIEKKKEVLENDSKTARTQNIINVESRNGTSINITESTIPVSEVSEKKAQFVDYEGTWFSKDPSTWDAFPGIFYPQRGCVIFPYRHEKNKRGHSELKFQRYLASYLDKLTILEDVAIHIADFCRPYKPDIAIVYRSIRLDIEIDEPYDGLNRKPIHYIGCGDESRDMNLTSAGWIVIRFAEIDVVKRPAECLHRILGVIQHIYSDYYPSSVPDFDGTFHKRRRWSKNEAMIMALKKERERYLEIDSFGVTENERVETSGILQTKEEKCAAALMSRIPTISASVTNIDRSSLKFEQDNHLSFIPEDHTYHYDNFLELQPVSDVVSSWFPEFNAVDNAIRKSGVEGFPPEYYLNMWDKKASEAREVGTFMHRQIENILNGISPQNVYSFKYANDSPEDISIEKELDLFKLFKVKESIVPFRTEWPICDIRHRIAGTIDCLCKEGNKFAIYDWKRTKNLIDCYGNLINSNAWGATGLRELSNLADCSFYHYALQQNLYRYMLENNYNIEVSHMYLIVLRSNYSKYYKIEVPRMDRELNVILNNL